MTNAEEKAQIEMAEKLLSEAGFALSISGCGCCGSPNVRLSYKGKPVIYDEEEPYFRMAECHLRMHDGD